MYKPQAILTVGISSSGKTTWAEKFVSENPSWVNINRDDVRFTLFSDGVRDWGKYKFSKGNENRVTEVCNQKIYDAAAELKDIIISDTNLNSNTRNRLTEILYDLGYEVSFKVFDISFEEACKRNNQRQGGISQTIIYTQYQNYLKYIGRKTYTPDVNKPKCVILDVDGTVAKVNGRGFFDWDKVSTDLPHQHVIDIVKGIQDDTYIVCMSGRDEVCRQDTEDWLLQHGIYVDELHMRKQGDMRKDTIVKEELFWEHVADNWNVQFAVDDRPSVLRLWVELGIPIISVGNPFIEF
jgi:predicted kinase